MSIWQTKEWQDMLKDSGQIEASFLLNNIYIEKRKVAFHEFGLFAIGVDLKEIKEDIINKLKELTKEQNALFFQIENISYENGDINLDCEKGYYKKFITPYTAIIDFDLREDEILAQMKQKGRYNIRLAEKKGVIIEDALKTDENIKIFYDLMLETTSRDSFNGNTYEYYKIFLNRISESHLLFAYYDDRVIAAGIFVYHDDVAIYYYGASTSEAEYRNLMAPYLLQWEAIKLGIRKGCKIYDFLGIASPGDENSPLKGVTDFKLKLTGVEKKVSTSYIYKHKKLKYYIIALLRKLKK